MATEVGFAGGTTAEPSYHDLGDVEAVRVSYDPAIISYEELLRVYWESHPHDLPPPEDPRVAVAVLFDGEHQEHEARDFLRSVGGRAAVSELRPLGRFTPAEQRQQKFHLQRARPELVATLGFVVSVGVASLHARAPSRRWSAYRSRLRDARRRFAYDLTPWRSGSTTAAKRCALPRTLLDSGGGRFRCPCTGPSQRQLFRRIQGPRLVDLLAVSERVGVRRGARGSVE